MSSPRERRPADNRAPVTVESSLTELPVTGAIPVDLDGRYLRNGPNPRSGSAHWFTGEGMLHGVRLQDGRARWYRNRWVRTAQWGGDPAPLYDPVTGHRNLWIGHANTHVVRHAGHTLALVESSLPWEVTQELETVGVYDFNGGLADSMTAHPKVCPTTGELHFFGYGALREPYVTYHRADAAGRVTVDRPVDVPGPTMMHDFAITDRFVLFLDLPVVFDPALAGQGMPYRWSETHAARIGVLRRADPDLPIRWFEIAPCYVFHVANAFEVGDFEAGSGGVVLQAVRYRSMWARSSHDFDPDGHLYQWRLGGDGTVVEGALDDRAIEFPRIDDRTTGRAHDAVYAVGRHHVARYAADGAAALELGADEPGELTHVPSADGRGYLLGFVYRAASARSDLVILDAAELTELARVHLGVRVPAGFHGDWFPDRG